MINDLKSFEWQRTPPAIFAVLLGGVATALLWIRNGDALIVGAWFGWFILACVWTIYVVLLVAYAAKAIRNPSVFQQDLMGVPGRQGLAAMTLVLMLLAGGLAPFAPGVAKYMLFLSLAGHLFVAVNVAFIVLRNKTERVVTPVWHLVFVGFIVGSQAAALLELSGLAVIILLVTFLVSLVVYGISLETIRKVDVPKPMRPLLMIHLAPLSLFGTTCVLLELQTTGLIFGVLATAVALVLLFRFRWITESGFSPAWAAFTFPVAAYAGLMVMLAGWSVIFWAIGAVLTLALTVYVPVLTVKLLRLCLDGRLAEATNAAKA